MCFSVSITGGSTIYCSAQIRGFPYRQKWRLNTSQEILRSRYSRRSWVLWSHAANTLPVAPLCHGQKAERVETKNSSTHSAPHQKPSTPSVCKTLQSWSTAKSESSQERHFHQQKATNQTTWPRSAGHQK